MADRFYTNDDVKKLVIDLAGSDFEVPAKDIYDSPIRYYKANQEWSSIIEGLLGWLTEITAWKDANDEDYTAIQQVMKFLEGVTIEEIIEESGMALTFDEMCKAVECGVINVFQRAVAGQDGNFKNTVEIGANGEISVKEGIAVDTPPSSALQALRWGGALKVQLELNNLLDFISDAQSANPQVSEGDLLLLLTFKYEIDEAKMTTAIASYYDDKFNMIPTIANYNGVDDYVFCEGVSKQSIGSFLVDTLAPASVETAFQIVDAIAQTQLQTWYDMGSSLPADGYQSAPCYRLPTQTITVKPEQIFNGGTGIQRFDIFPSQPSKPAGNRWQIEFSGIFTHVPTGLRWTFTWRETSVDDWVSNGTKMRINNTNNELSFQSYPLLSTDGKGTGYIQAGSNTVVSGLFWQTRPAWLAADVTGTLKITKYDLGT